MSHQDGPFKDHGRGGARLGSRLPLHSRIQLLKTENCSQVASAFGPGPGRQAAIWRPPGCQARSQDDLGGGPKDVNFGGPNPHAFWYSFWFIFGLSFWCLPEHGHYLRSVRRVLLFGVLWRTGCGRFRESKTRNYSKIYCPAASETSPKAGGMEERLFWESWYFPLLWDPLKNHVFGDVVRTCFGSYFRGPCGDPVWRPFGSR